MLGARFFMKCCPQAAKLCGLVDLEEGEDAFVCLERFEDRVRRLRKYRGMLGRASREEIEDLLLEAEFEHL